MKTEAFQSLPDKVVLEVKRIFPSELRHSDKLL